MALETELDSLLQRIIKDGPKELDLTNDRHAADVYEAANQFLEFGITIDGIDMMEKELIQRNDGSLIYILLVLKILRSKILIRRFDGALRISVIFAVYKEHNRIKNSSEHPHGENFLVKKVEQLRWLFDNRPDISWQLIVVDDGCPEGSGIIAQQIIERENLKEDVRVLFLADAINESLGPAKKLSSTAQSQKGGSIVYGMWDAVQTAEKENHIVAFTDADLSTHLGQIGLLLDPILNRNKLAAIGSRREPDSVVIKKGARNNRGKLFIYLWKRLISNLGEIVDTQCGFKAFRAQIIPGIIDDLIETKFAFDIELLLRTALIEATSIEKVAIAWIDSEAASTTTDLQPYLPMLKSIVKMYRKYFTSEAEMDDFAAFLEGLSDEDFMILLDCIPTAILDREPYEFNEYNSVKVSDFKANMRQ